MNRLVKFMICAALLFVATAAHAQTIDAILKGNYGSAGDILCHEGTNKATFDTPTNCGAAPSSNAPTASGYVLCGGGPLTASFTDPASCGLATGTNYWTLSGSNVLSTQNPVLVDATGTTSTSWAKLGFYMTGGTQTGELQMVDVNTGLLAGWGERMTLLSYHGIVVRGATGGSTPTVESGGGSGDPSLAIVGAHSASCGSNSNGGCALRVDKDANGTITTGTPISFIGRQTFTDVVSPTAIGANNCTLHAVTLAGAAVNAGCVASAPTTPGNTLFTTCYVSATNTVQIKICNVGTTSITPPSSGVYSAWVINP